MDFEYRYYFSEVPGRGRCIFASRDIRKGDVVLVEDAFVLAINKRHAEVSCSHCGVTCDSSGTVYQVYPDDPLRYCSEHCITIDYPVHQLELPAFAATTALAEVFGQETYRVLIRLAALRKKGGGAEDTEGAAAPRFPEVGRSGLSMRIL